MKAMIRWQGLGVFATVTALICLFTLFFIDPIIKGIIEKQGSAIVGARVELAEADLTFFPAGLVLSSLQITNPDQPLRNIVEIDQLAMSLDAMRLLQRKIIIEQMAMEGIRPDTPRLKSGALPGYAARKKVTTSGDSKKGFQTPKLQIPDVKEILGKEKLASLELAKNYQAQIKADTLKWQQQLAELPDESKLAQYKARLNKLQSSSGLAGLLGGATELVAIRQE
ncbi:MAG: TIGR03545 family protein, partial [Desulfobulbaceae bacterium]|nr:TIGR03545 family protein [Desulfobulbaceae bacterium]